MVSSLAAMLAMAAFPAIVFAEEEGDAPASLSVDELPGAAADASIVIENTVAE